MHTSIESIESLAPMRVRLARIPQAWLRRRPTAVFGIVVAFALAVVLANAPAWLPVLLVYVMRLRSRKSDQRAQLALHLGISTGALEDKKVVGFFHPSWFVLHTLPCNFPPHHQPNNVSAFTVTRAAIKNGSYGQLSSTSSARNRIS